MQQPSDPASKSGVSGSENNDNQKQRRDASRLHGNKLQHIKNELANMRTITADQKVRNAALKVQNQNLKALLDNARASSSKNNLPK
eukprot:IDg3062t1